MSLINMLNVWQWLLMATVPPLIIMLYFLKLRRQPIEVPSTYLWKRTIEDLHVNSIWQRLRKNLLLLLQLLVVLALILALLRPGYRGSETLGDRSIFLIDNSASMQATDSDDGSRLAEAKRKAIDMIDALQRNDVGMVIAFSDRADVRQGFTSDKNKLKKAIQSITSTNRTTDLNEALRAASGLANPGRTSQIEDLNDVQVAEAIPATLYVLSDGGFPTPQLDLGNLSAEYLPVGSPLPSNVGILAFTVERNLERNGQLEAFARIQNFSADSQTFTVSLSLDGELIDARELTLEEDSVSGVSFEIDAIDEGQLQLELDIEDDLQMDNVAFAGIDPPKLLEVLLVTEGNTALETALRTEAAVSLATVRVVGPADLESEEIVNLSASGKIDLIIYDGVSPKKMPQCNTLFFASLPTVEGWELGEATGPLFIIDTNRKHPMLQYVDMGTVRIVEGQPLTLPQGGTELVRTDAGVLAGVAPRDAFQDAVVGMQLARKTDEGTVPNTDWPIKRSFPVFVFNSLEFLGGAVTTAGSKTIKPGQSAVLNLANRFDEIEITDPDGGKRKLNRDGAPSVIYTDTDSPGFYEATPAGSDRVLQMFAVNLFSEQESRIEPASEVTIGAETIASNTQQLDIVRIEYWRWLLGLALLLLSVEWYLYNRRVAV